MSPEEIKTAIKTKFSALLTEEGTSVDTPDLFLAWEAFKAFTHRLSRHTADWEALQKYPVHHSAV